MKRWFSWPARRPVAALVVAAVIAALCVVAVRRVHPSASLEAMMSKNDPAVKAAVRVLNAFPAAEELLVLATVPEQRADVDRLLGFARRLEEGIRKSPEASRLCDSISYQADPQFREYIEKELVPSGLYYLDRPSFEAARARLTREQMAEQFRQNEA